MFISSIYVFIFNDKPLTEPTGTLHTHTHTTGTPASHGTHILCRRLVGSIRTGVHLLPLSYSSTGRRFKLAHSETGLVSTQNFEATAEWKLYLP